MKKKDLTTIYVDSTDGFDKTYDREGNLDDWSGNALMIGEEVIEILPLNSKEGILFTITDGKKAAQIRLKRN